MKKTGKLSALPVGEAARIVGISASASLKRRLTDLGVIKGAKIEAALSSPFGNLTAYSICETLIALRKADADKIIVEF